MGILDSVNRMILWIEIICAVSMIGAVANFKKFLQTPIIHHSGENIGVLQKYAKWFFLLNSILQAAVFVSILYAFYLDSWFNLGQLRALIIPLVLLVVSALPVDRAQKNVVPPKAKRDIMMGFSFVAVSAVSYILFLWICL
jgi:hypothetical protein